jgi:four helix bundle protein
MRITSHRELDVYKKAFDAAMMVFELSKLFPREETYSLTDQIRRSSRSVCANLTEAWRKRRYLAAFLCKLNDSEAEAAETQTWIEFAVKSSYLTREQGAPIFCQYDEILAMLVSMIHQPEKWLIPSAKTGARGYTTKKREGE